MEDFRTRVGPVVCIVSTPGADNIARHHGGLCKLLSTAEPGTGPMTFRSASRHLTIGSLRVRFIPADAMAPGTLDTAEGSLRAALTVRSDEVTDVGVMMCSRSCCAFDLLRARREQGEWVSRWRAAIELSQAHVDHEAFECPAILVLAAASTEPAGIAIALENLGSAYNLPSGFRDGRFDSRATPRHVLIIHDASGTGDARAALSIARGALSKISEDAPATARLLALNAGRDADSAEIRRLTAELVHAGVVPALERRIAALGAELILHFTSFILTNDQFSQAALHANITASRKGVRNVFKSWLRRPKEAIYSTHAEKGVTCYPHETAEAQIRLLADTAFAIGDLDTAIAHYRLARDDFRADRALLHMGSAHEMIARVLFSLAAPNHSKHANASVALQMDTTPVSGDKHAHLLRRDAIAAAAAAVSALLAAANDAKRAAVLPAESEGDRRRDVTRAARALTRAALVAADCRLVTTHPAAVIDSRMPPTLAMRAEAEAAADALVSAAQFETNLCAAVLYERAAWRYYAGGLGRKAALHLVMAGHRYRACGCVDIHAVECYVAARAAYTLTYKEEKGGNKQGWPRIDEHVEYALGRQLDVLGLHALGLRCTITLLASARPPPDRHALLVQVFVSAARAHPDALAHAAAMLQQSHTSAESSGTGEDYAVVNATLAISPDLVPGTPLAAHDKVVVVGLTLPVVLQNTVIVSTASDLGSYNRAAGLCWVPNLASVFNAECWAAEASAKLSTSAGLAACARARITVEAAITADTVGNQQRRERLRSPPPLSSDNDILSPCEVWPRWCGRAESIDVDVVLRNPLATPVDLTHVHVVCTLDVGRDAARRLIPTVPQASSGLQVPPVPDDPFLAALSHLADVRDATKTDGPTPWLSEHIRLTLPARGTNGAGSAIIRLRCGAAAAGTMRVVGIRWRLLGAVWGAVALRRCGPLLYRTREERSRSVRAPDASLAVHVVGDIPRIVARVVDTTSAPASPWPIPCHSHSHQPPQSPLSALDGEIRHARIDVRNVGRALAADIVCRAASPWLALADPLGTAGLAWEISSINLPPGAQASVPAAVRVEGLGSCMLRAVLQYAPAAAIAEIPPPRCWPPPGDSDPEAEDIFQRALAATHAKDITSTCMRQTPLVVMYTVTPSFQIRTSQNKSPACAGSSSHSLALELTRPREEIVDSALLKGLTIDRIFVVNREALSNALEPAAPPTTEIDIGVVLARCESLTLQLSIAPNRLPRAASFGTAFGRQALLHAATNAARYDRVVAAARTAHVIPSPLRTIQALRRAGGVVPVTNGLNDDNNSVSLAIEWHCDVNGAISVGQHHVRALA